MTTLDAIILGFVALMAVYGYLQGFLVGALSLAGFLGGAFIGTRLGPHLLPRGASSPYAPLFGLIGALVAGFILAVGLEGLGARLRWMAARAHLGILDGLLGAILTAAIGLALAWILAAVALQLPDATVLRRDIQRSAVLRRLNAALPPSGSVLHALARFDPFPRISGPGARVAPPTAAIARDPQVRADAPAVVRVLGNACGLGIEGSGWVAAPGVVVTNAHVVAGERDTVVQAGGAGEALPARAVHFDPRNDIAVLHVAGLDGTRLSFAPSAPTGTAGALLGFPENGPYDVSPVRLGATRRTVSQDAYGRGPVTRLLTSLRGVVRSGNSGGPIVDGRGRVLATVFAATVGSPQRGGFAIPNAVVRGALDDSSSPVGTGPCAG